MSEYIYCADLGSTFTKGALFKIDKTVQVAARYDVPTTRHNLEEGWRESLSGCLEKASLKKADRLLVSSSAKGGLGIVAVGLVKELTMKAGCEAAISGGAKILASFSGSLEKSDIKSINDLSPDIILFTGGTERGNREAVLHNAHALSSMHTGMNIIYAGNSALRMEISEILKPFDLYFAENVMPEVNVLSAASAKNTIREIFLKKIIEGKGISAIGKLASLPVMPTPLAVYNFCRELFNRNIFEHPFLLLDPGGATTDLYSACPPVSENSMVLRGMPEQTIKRTVEGDLGMRFNAESALQTAGEKTLTNKKNYIWTEKLAKQPEILPQNSEEKENEKNIAAACVRTALMRHAGAVKKYYTLNGETAVQTGKDLRPIRIIISSGGYTGRFGTKLFFEEILSDLKKENSGKEDELLLPENCRFWADYGYLLPLLALLTHVYPDEACRLFKDSLTELN